MAFSNAEVAAIRAELRKVAAERHRYHVFPPHGGRGKWVVVESGGDTRAKLTARTRETAVQRARELAMEFRGEMVVHSADGHIQEHLSFRDAVK